MKDIKLVLEFETIKALVEYCKATNHGCDVPVSNDQYNPKPVASSTSVLPKASAKPAVLPTETVQAPPRAKGVRPAPGETTQVMVKNAMREYKAVHGNSPYKELLAYFGAATVRDIPKSEYTAVVQMASAGTPVTEAPAPAPAPVEVLPSPADVLPVPANLMPILEEEEEEITPEQLRQGLSDHKAQWGMDATKAVLARLGHSDPNKITSDQYGKLLHALENDSPALHTGTIDLSAF